MTPQRFPIVLLLAPMLLALAGCATPTPYQPQSEASAYGWTTTRLEDQRFRIGFAGNSLTERETVENYLLYRAAEVTLEAGYDHFIMLGQDTDTLITYRTTSLDGWPYWSAGWGWGGYDRWDGRVGVADARTTPSPRYEATAMISLGQGTRPDDPNAFDARSVLQNLGPGIIRSFDPPPP